MMDVFSDEDEDDPYTDFVGRLKGYIFFTIPNYEKLCEILY